MRHPQSGRPTRPLPSRGILFAASLALAFAGPAAYADGPPSADPSFSFRVDTPPIEAVASGDGFADLRIRDFATRSQQVGAPDVPTRTVLVAIPPGSTPRLAVRLTGPRTRRALRPRPVPRIVPAPRAAEVAGAVDDASLRDDDGRSVRRLYEPDEELYGGEGTLPPRVAWLGETGVLRRQRYVEVHLAPVRFDRRAGELVVDRGLEVTVHFDGALAGGDPPAADDRFESVYRRSFENYSQGRRFRLSGVETLTARGQEKTRGATASTGPIGRIRVGSDGIVRLDPVSIGADLPEFLSTDPRTWRLTQRGVPVPLQIHQEVGNDALLEPGEWVQFYGQALDDEPDTVLNYDHPTGPYDNLYAVRDFTDENVYFLTVDAAVQPTMTERDATPSVGTPEIQFEAVVRKEIDDKFVPLPDELWYWSPFTLEGDTRVEEVALPGLAAGTLPARFRVGLRGFPYDCVELDPDHITRVGLTDESGVPLVLPGDNPDNVGNQNVGEFDGNALFVHDFDWVHAGADPELTHPLRITLEAAEMDIPCSFVPTGNVINDVILDFIEIEYQRKFEADGDILEFSVPDGDRDFEIPLFASDAVEVYEVTNELASSGVVDTIRLTGVTVTPDLTTHTVRFHVDNDPLIDDTTLRRFVVVGHGAIPAPDDVAPDRVSTLLSDTSAADLVVIAHPDLLDSQCSEGGNPCRYDVDCTGGATDRCDVVAGSALDALMALRAGQGVASRVARIQDVEDEFNDGLPGPLAIESFLGWLMAGGWGPAPPVYVMLIGDGSYDYKAGTAEGSFVPTQIMVKLSEFLGHYASDNLLAAVVGDDSLPEMAVGRITARTPAEAHGILQKIVNYGQGTPAGDWRHSVLLISDRGRDYDPQETHNFEAMNDLAASFLAGTNYSGTHLRYGTDYCSGNSCDIEGMRQDILDRVNALIGDGVAVTQFVGHGNFDVWSDDAFFCGNENNSACLMDDTTRLFNNLKLPFLIAHNCLTGGFHTVGPKTMGEQWLKRLLGGAVASFAPSGLGFRFISNVVIAVIWDDIFGPHKERVLATPVMNSLTQLCTQGSIEACQFYTLLGDPSTRLVLPDVAPATGLVATASEGMDASVELSWTASATPGATYDVYRTLQLEQAYTRINGMTPIAGTSFMDTDVQHTRTYYYYVVASDAGFESAWSNFNSDCGEPPGDDCVQARPLNLTPPAVPTGLTVTDAESGGRLDLVWNPNDEVDIQSYTVHFGTTPAYGQTRTFTGTFGYLGGLVNGTPYYVGIQARNTSQTESEISDPAVMGVPLQILGVKAPDLVRDLRLAKSGSDAELTWGAVTQDIYGRAVAVSHYEVFRGTEAAFVPASGEAHATEVGTVHVDGEALTDGAEAYFYLVRAVDGSGNAGGLGRQLPEGIRDLRIVPLDTPPDAIDLSWSAVTTDFDGNPTTVVYYEVYASDEPFGRGDLEDGAVALVAPMVVGPTVQIHPTGPERYYSVLAVDARGNRSPF